MEPTCCARHGLRHHLGERALILLLGGCLCCCCCWFALSRDPACRATTLCFFTRLFTCPAFAGFLEGESAIELLSRGDEDEIIVTFTAMPSAF